MTSPYNMYSSRPKRHKSRGRLWRILTFVLVFAALTLKRIYFENYSVEVAEFDPKVLRLLANVSPAERPPVDLPRCSLNFFGLPRSFRAMALPSIVKNVLIPNAKYECDIVVHYYKIDRDSGGRYNRGGTVDADSVLALGEAAAAVAKRAGTPEPSVVFKRETMEEFLEKYGKLVRNYETATNPRTGKPKYFPWFEQSYSKAANIIRNVVMQWNSIQSAWDEMERHATTRRIQYERIAFVRTDALYAFPIDIYRRDKYTVDYNNTYAVVPAFGKYPVSDRMIYGPANAVKIWASERFKRLERHVARYEQRGYGMHSERYMGHEILPSIVIETGVEVVENADICFYRTRAADSVMIDDCSDRNGGAVRGIFDVDEVALIEGLVDRRCTKYPYDEAGLILELRCDQNATSLKLQKADDT